MWVVGYDVAGLNALMIWRIFRWLGERWLKPLELGERGEHLAEQYYRRLGCKILARNWRSGQDELDLVVLDGAVLVFVEVKTRTADFGGQGYRAVDRRKRNALRRAANAWIWQIGGVPHRRFDILEVMVCQDGTVRMLQHRGVPLFKRRRP